jgi:hypothetical protein
MSGDRTCFRQVALNKPTAHHDALEFIYEADLDHATDY